jgi:hypothetical protein
MKRIFLFLVASLIAVAAYVHATGQASAPDAPDVARASFDQNGRAVLPTGYRQWQHIGTRYKPDGVNILDGLPAPTPEVLNAYVEPGAFAVFRRTGKWPEGTQIVKEFSAVKVGHGCDANTHVCSSDLGRGIYESNFVGLGMMIKDTKRFPSTPGHWGYFTFGHKPPPYDPVAQVAPRAKCSTCHERLAADTDYVISRAHIGLDENQKLRLPVPASP